MSSRKKSTRVYQQVQPPSSNNDWLNRIARLNTYFGRFLRDISGVTLITIAIMSILAVWQWTDGVLLKPWGNFLRVWFGWGSYIVVTAIGYSGYILFQREKKRLPTGQLISLEIASLLTLGLLAVFGGNSLTRAETGLDGGRLGWGVSKLASIIAGDIGGFFIILVLWALSVMSGFGLWKLVEAKLANIAGIPPQEDERPQPQAVIVGTEDISESQTSPATASAQPAAKRKPNPIPSEFRTTLKSQQNKEQKPARPVRRDESLPPMGILLGDNVVKNDERQINQTAGMIMKTLSEFGIPATVIGFRVGPAITQFAVQPGFIKKPGTDEEDVQQMKVRVAQIASLQKDLALALSAERLRIEAPVPGKPYVGIEVPNPQSSTVRLRSLMEAEAFNKVGAPLTLALGRDVSGHPLIADLSRMPHVLIAGSTGSGKSVCITAIAACLAMNNSPEDLRMIMIDSKMVELIRFNGLPHLFGKVETNVNRILGVLRWVVVEMEHRYRLLESAHARDIDSYNKKVSRRADIAALPRIVVLIDELADLMMSAPDQTEHNLVRLAQMARATGIHLVVATQRPSTDVVTGLIKANFPARLAFAVASGVDSRVILDTTGAESLLGRGDMLFLNPEVGNPIRAQGVLITDNEIEKIIDHWQKTNDTPVDDTPPWEKLLSEPDEGDDDGLIEQAISIVKNSQRASASMLQRRLRVGYPRAARLLDQLEEMGVVGPSQGGGKERDVLLSPDDLDNEKEAEEGM
jgi:S-DNA-T family DNA segregation ATPase FtsK/SpoIIIE